MNTYRTTVSWLIAGSLPLIGMVGIPSVSVGEDAFVETEYGSLLDTQTGLEWGKDFGQLSGMTAPQAYIAGFYYEYSVDPKTGELMPPPGLEYAGIDPETNAPYTDWRRPTVGEVHEAIDNGILDYIDFDLSYEPGIQSPDEYGEVYFWTVCTDRWKNLTLRYKILFNAAKDYLLGSGAGQMLAVRGGPEDHGNCPGKHGGADDQGKPDKPGKPKK